MTSTQAPPALETDRRAAEAALARFVDARVGGTGAVTAALRYAVQGGGKRVRPILCAATYRAAAGAEPPDAVYDIAVAIELVHTYSLVHDDLPCMDDDALRRGRPTVHRAFGWRVATVAGAALIPLAAAQLAAGCRALGLDDARTGEVARTLARAAGGGGMVGGQLLDLDAEGRPLAVDALEAIHARKTGALFAASVRIGGLLAGFPPARVEALGRYGAALGLAFQIADDVLDETASADVVGKETGKDRDRAKATFPGLLGVTGAAERARETVAAGIAALEEAGIEDDTLRALIRFAADRDR